MVRIESKENEDLVYATVESSVRRAVITILVGTRMMFDEMNSSISV